MLKVIKMFLVGFVLAAVVCAQARTFENPIIGDKLYFYPGAIKVKDTYYVVSIINDITNGIFPIHSSTNLTDWKFEGYVFNVNNTPAWARSDTLNYPEIYKIGSNFVVYFSAFTTQGLDYHVGVAVAQHPLGPYSSIDRPLLARPNEESRLPSIIKDQENVTLVWSNSSYEIMAGQLNTNGLTFSSDQFTALIKPDLAWENGYVDSAWHIRRGTYHYLFYNGGGWCNGVGVARSTNILGPYEKRPNPILAYNSNFECMSDARVLKDLDEKNDIVFFNAYRSDDMSHQWAILVSSIHWTSEGWPYVEDF